MGWPRLSEARPGCKGCQTSINITVKKDGKGYLSENRPKSRIAVAVTCAAATLPGLHPAVAQRGQSRCRIPTSLVTPARLSSPTPCLWPARSHQPDSSPVFLSLSPVQLGLCRSEGLLGASQAWQGLRFRMPCGVPLPAELLGLRSCCLCAELGGVFICWGCRELCVCM